MLNDKKKIIAWLDKYQVKNYSLLPYKEYGYVVDVLGQVNLRNKGLTIIPVKFNNVLGYMDCSGNDLTSLEFSPQYVEKSFWCKENKLTTLKGATDMMVGNDFNCSDNQLKSLEFCPKTTNGSFYCNNNEIVSLEYCPQMVYGEFYCDGNPLLGSLQKTWKFSEICEEHFRVKDLIEFNQQLNVSLKIKHKAKNLKI